MIQYVKNTLLASMECVLQPENMTIVSGLVFAYPGKYKLDRMPDQPLASFQVMATGR